MQVRLEHTEIVPLSLKLVHFPTITTLEYVPLTDFLCPEKHHCPWNQHHDFHATDRPLSLEIHATSQNFLPLNPCHWTTNFSLKFMLTEVILFLRKCIIRPRLNIWKCVQRDNLFRLEICPGNLYPFLLRIPASLPAWKVFGFQRSHFFLWSFGWCIAFHFLGILWILLYIFCWINMLWTCSS